MAHGKRVSEPRSAVELAESVALARRLVSLGAEQLKRAEQNFALARVGLAELEAELSRRGMKGGAV